MGDDKVVDKALGGLCATQCVYQPAVTDEGGIEAVSKLLRSISGAGSEGMKGVEGVEDSTLPNVKVRSR